MGNKVATGAENPSHKKIEVTEAMLLSGARAYSHFVEWPSCAESYTAKVKAILMAVFPEKLRFSKQPEEPSL